VTGYGLKYVWLLIIPRQRLTVTSQPLSPKMSTTNFDDIAKLFRLFDHEDGEIPSEVDDVYENGGTALMAATHHGNVEMVRMILRVGGDVNKEK